MTGQNEKVERIRQDHWVFPVLLMDTANLVAAVDKHIESLLDDPVSFQSFPLYRSPLQVLKAIYLYYKKSLPDVSFNTPNLAILTDNIELSPSTNNSSAKH